MWKKGASMLLKTKKSSGEVAIARRIVSEHDKDEFLKAVASPPYGPERFTIEVGRVYGTDMNGSVLVTLRPDGTWHL
jgi:hypothetical protein